MSEIKGVHVVSPGPHWESRPWLVVTDEGGLFCDCYYGSTAEGGDARQRAELIAKAVNAYLRAAPHVEGGRDER